MAKNGRVDPVKMYRDRAIAAETDRDHWRTIAMCSYCEPWHDYICTKHREEDNE